MGDVVAIAPVSTAKRPDLTTANLAAQMSNISILPAKHAVPQSARSYLQAENLLDPRVKVKSRSETSSGTFSETEKRTGFLSKFLGKDNENQQDEPKKSRNTWFSKLAAKKKSAQLMHQLLRTSEDDTMGMVSMKWEDFLKLMREMGFEYDPSTAGSSVRFDPPDPKDVSITFHKPHPDPTLHPMMLREFAKKLKKNYGWCEADFLSAGTPPKNIKLPRLPPIRIPRQTSLAASFLIHPLQLPTRRVQKQRWKTSIMPRRLRLRSRPQGTRRGPPRPICQSQAMGQTPLLLGRQKPSMML
ncbi:hypothetical protein C8R45DRAFT_100912 [Mycena sanguinolenta]|nr:hypothetical protein C8R45DRAFT_100912 [Mycena sanguinolenta]